MENDPMNSEHDPSAGNSYELKLARNIEQLKQSALGLKGRHLKALAGTLVERMMKSREEAEEFLRAADTNIRRAAIIVIVDHWGSSPAFENYCIQTVTQNSDTDLRITALSALAKVYTGTADQRVSRILAEVLRHEEYPDNLRAMAYLGLLRVCSKKADRATKERVLKGQFQFSDDVDWEFVNQHLDQST
jgi:hypothetical protein